ncbi:MAG: hypothetical protein R2865_01255 [Deinococcales bacterium]
MKDKFLALFLILELMFVGQAQELLSLLPASSAVVFGTTGLAEYQDKTQDFVATFKEMQVGKRLLKALSSGADMAELETLAIEPGAFINQEAWLALDGDALNPIIILLAKPSAQALQLVQEGLAETELLAEDGYNIYAQPLDLEDASEAFKSIFISLDEANFVISNDKAALKAILARQQLGVIAEDAFVMASGYQNSLGRLGKGQFYSYINYALLAERLLPALRDLSAEVGLGDLLDKLAKAFATAGVSASVTRIVDEGLVSEGWQLANSNGGDKALYKLLSESTPLNFELNRLIPQDALSYSLSSFNLAGWWAYLNDLSKSVPALGMTLDELAEIFVGIKPARDLLSQLSPDMATAVTGIGEVVAPGMPNSNFLGEGIYIFKAKDISKAASALDLALNSIAQSVAMFSDPTGGMGDAQVEDLSLAGVIVKHFEMASGIALAYVVVEDNIIVGTSLESLEKSLLAYQSGEHIGLTGVYGSSSPTLPPDASSFNLSNMASTMRSTSEQIKQQVAVIAGLSGSSNLDFDAVDEATQVLGDYLNFVADKLGYSSGYSQKTAKWYLQL